MSGASFNDIAGGDSQCILALMTRGREPCYISHISHTIHSIGGTHSKSLSGHRGYFSASLDIVTFQNVTDIARDLHLCGSYSMPETISSKIQRTASSQGRYTVPSTAIVLFVENCKSTKFLHVFCSVPEIFKIWPHLLWLKDHIQVASGSYFSASIKV